MLASTTDKYTGETKIHERFAHLANELANINTTLEQIRDKQIGTTADVFTVVHVLLWLRSLLTECDCGIQDVVKRFNAQVTAKKIEQYEWYNQCNNYLKDKNGKINNDLKNLKDFFDDPICKLSTADNLNPANPPNSDSNSPEFKNWLIKLEQWRDERVYDIDDLHTALIAYFPKTTTKSTGQPTGEQEWEALQERLTRLEQAVTQTEEKAIKAVEGKIAGEVKKNLGDLSPQTIQELAQQIKTLDTQSLQQLKKLLLIDKDPLTNKPVLSTLYKQVTGQEI